MTELPASLPLFDGVHRKLHVPILLYHQIRVPPLNVSDKRRSYSVTPDHFRAQMEWLKANGYVTISLYDLVSALNTGAELPARPVIITFDDGYADNYQNAFPVLRSLGMTATFFILTANTNQFTPGYMTWDNLREMAAAGMSIELHGVRHLSMIGHTDAWLAGTLQDGAVGIQDHLGYRPRFIAYPNGLYDARIIEAVHNADFWGALTTRHSAYPESTRPFELPRLDVRYILSLSWFIRLVETDY